MTSPIDGHAKSCEDGSWCVIPPSGGEIGSGSPRRLQMSPRGRSAVATLCIDSGVQPFQAILALWAVVLSQYTDVQCGRIWVSGARGEPRRLLAASLADRVAFRALLDKSQWEVTTAPAGTEANTGVLWDQNPGQMLGSSNAIQEVCDLFWVVHAPCQQEPLAVEFWYRPGFLSEAVATTVMERMETLVFIVCQDADQNIRQLTMPTRRDMERQRDWQIRPTQAVEPMQVSVHKHCVQSPDRLAVIAGDGSLTYRELDGLVARAASLLVQVGIRSGALVPICFTKSLWAVVAMVAINRVGAAFVPLDPTLQTPMQQRDIVDQLGATVAVTGEACAAALQEMVDQVVVLSDQTVPTAGPSDQEKGLALTPPPEDSPAYVLFTSGSTGKPKGCVVCQSAFDLFVVLAPNLGLRPGDRAFHFASLTFAIGIIEVFCAVGLGATVCMPADHSQRKSVSQEMANLRVEWAMLTPTVLGILDPGNAPHLQRVVLAGEAPSPAQLELWAAAVHLRVAYGLTESSITLTISDRITPGRLRPGNVGFPINVTAWVVDPQDHDRLQPVGSPGELVIAGPSLAHGYLNQPDKAAVVFIPPPRWADPKDPTARYYKTGDLMRHDPDGSLVHLGRKDRQAKVRGIRVDLPSVEHAVGKHFPKAREVVAEVVPTSTSTSSRLAVFLLQEDPISAGGDILAAPTMGFISQAKRAEQQLSVSLPSFMVPSVFFPVLHIPRTRTGKTDRNRLRERASGLAPDKWIQYKINAPVETVPDSACQTDRSLRRIFANVLAIPPERVGPDADFFELGGDSVSAMRMAEMARVAGLSLHVHDVLTCRTLAAIAARAHGVQTLPDEALPRSLADDALKQRCVSEARRKWTLPAEVKVVDVLPATRMQALYINNGGLDSFGFLMVGEVDVDRLREACRAVVRRHAALRTIFTRTGTNLFQIVLESLDPPFECVTMTDDLTTFRQRFCFAGPDPSAHLDRPTVGFTWARDPAGRQHAFFVQLSHAQHDGASIPVLFQDLSAAYREPFTSPVMGFPDFLYYRARPGCVAAARQFWARYLEGAAATMPTIDGAHSPAGGTASPVFARASARLAPCPAGVTVGSVLRAAWAYVLSHAAATADVTFGHFVNARSLPLKGIDRVLGPCSHIIPCRVRRRDGWTVCEYLDHVHQDYLQTVRHDHLELNHILDAAAGCAPGTGVGTILLHQNIDSNRALHFDDARSIDSDLFMKFQKMTDIWVFSYPSATALDLRVLGPDSLLSQELCTRLVGQLAGLVQTFLETPDMRLSDIDLSTVGMVQTFLEPPTVHLLGVERLPLG